jgi:hypothetical protein
MDDFDSGLCIGCFAEVVASETENRDFVAGAAKSAKRNCSVKG